MNLSSELPAGQALALLLQSAVVLTIGLIAARMVRSKGPAWTTMIFRATLSTVFVAALVTPFLRPSPHPIVSIPAPASGPKISWPVAASHVDSKPLPEPAPRHVRRGPAYAPPETFESPVPVEGPKGVSVRDMALIVWGVGSVALLISLAFGQLWLWTRRRSATGKPTARVSASLNAMAARHRVTLPQVVISSDVHSPFVAGVVRPIIYIPIGFENKFDSEQIEAILSHEIVHIRHMDCLWNLISKLVCALAWPNPLSWFVARQMKLASEELCDQTVIQQGLQPKSYAQCLMRVAELTSATRTERLVGVGVIEFRSTLGKRVALVLDGSRRSVIRMSQASRFATAGAISLAAIATCLLISAHRPAAKPQGPAEIALPKADPTAQAYLDSCLAAYKKLHSYSARVTSGVGDFDSTTFDVNFKRPNQLLVNIYRKDRLDIDAQIIGEKDRFYVISPDHPKTYVLHERPGSTPDRPFGEYPWYRDNSALLASMGSCFLTSGLAEEALTSELNGMHQLNRESVTFGPERKVDGHLIKTVVQRQQQSNGAMQTMTLEIDDSDRLIRKEATTFHQPHSQDYVTTETYSNVQANRSGNFSTSAPPANWKRIVAREVADAQSPSGKLLTSQLELVLKQANTISFVDDEVIDQPGIGHGQPGRHVQHVRMTAELEKPLKAHIKLTLADYPHQNLELIADGKQVYVLEGTSPGKYFGMPATTNDIARMGNMGIPVNSCQAALDMIGVAFPNGIGGSFKGEVGKPSTFNGEPVDTLIKNWGKSDRYGFPEPGGGSRTYLLSKSDHVMRQAVEKMGRPGSASIMTETFSNFQINAPIPDQEFAFDTTGKSAVSSPEQAASYSRPEVGLNLHLGDSPPDFHSIDLNGKSIWLDQYRGKVVLLYGWTLGIGNYEWDLPHFKRLYDKYGKQGLVTIGIPYDGRNDLPVIKKFLKDHNITTPQVFDGMGREAGIQKLYKTYETMFDYVIDRKGKLYAKDPWDKNVDKAVVEALAR